MTREQLATLLENEAHNAAAEAIRSGRDPRLVLSEKLIARTRYDDTQSREAQATFRDIVAGKVVVS